jgi:hypothetical protein
MRKIKDGKKGKRNKKERHIKNLIIIYTLASKLRYFHTVKYAN